jgi:hypothetical protein
MSSPFLMAHLTATGMVTAWKSEVPAAGPVGKEQVTVNLRDLRANPIFACYEWFSGVRIAVECCYSSCRTCRRSLLAAFSGKTGKFGKCGTLDIRSWMFRRPRRMYTKPRLWPRATGGNRLSTTACGRVEAFKNDCGAIEVLCEEGLKSNRLRLWTAAKRYLRQAWRVLFYDAIQPVWFFALGITRPVRRALGLRAGTLPRSRERV